MHAWQGIHVRDHPTDSNNRCELRYPGNSTTPPVSFFQCALLGAMEAGPSPRPRGKPIGQSCRYVRLGSIPAPAGETAFRHHRVLRYHLPPHTADTDIGAQRLSASQGATPALADLTAVADGCVQRLSASQGATPATQGQPDRLGHVLNAFRHHRVLRPQPKVSQIGWDTCSTPFGITGCYAEIQTNALTLVISCSTPFGITGCYAPGHRARSRLPNVLNAFRHHRVLRRHYKRGNGRTCGWVVLNAFRHHRVLRQIKT